MNSKRVKLNKIGRERLYKLLAKTTNEKEIRNLLCDLITAKEVNEIARRLQAIEMLIEGMTYTEINNQNQMSPITINKMNYKLKFGFGGLNVLFKTIREYGERIYNETPSNSKVIKLYKLTPEERYFQTRIDKNNPFK